MLRCQWRTLSPPRNGPFKTSCRDSPETLWESWACWLNKVIWFWSKLAEAPCQPAKRPQIFFFWWGGPCFILYCSLALPVFYHGSMSREAFPYIPATPFISKFLHKGLFMQGRSNFIPIIGSSLTTTCLSLSTTPIPLGISWSWPWVHWPNPSWSSWSNFPQHPSADYWPVQAIWPTLALLDEVTHDYSLDTRRGSRRLPSKRIRT